MTLPNSDSFSFDTVEISREEYCYTYEQAANLTSVSVTLIERFVTVNLIEAEDAKLREKERSGPYCSNVAITPRSGLELGWNRHGIRSIPGNRLIESSFTSL